MKKLYPIVRRVRRPLLPMDEPYRRRDAEVASVPDTALLAGNGTEQSSEQHPVTSTAPEEISDGTPETTAETAVLSETKE